MSFEEKFYAVLQEQAEAGGRGWQQDFAVKCGIEQNALSRIMSGATKSPTLKNVAAIVDQLGWEAFQESAPTIRRLGPNAPMEAVQGENLPRVPVLGSAGAGEPHEFWAAEPVSMLEVLPQYDKPDLVALTVEGESMEPTIKRGSIVGVVPPDGDLTEGGVYLVDVPPFGRVIKRLKIGGEDSLELVSDNPAYPPKSLPIEQRERAVVGRVVWVWQMV